MFLISLPKGRRTGPCKINGQPANYKLHDDKIEFRLEGEIEWQERHILDQNEAGGLVSYVCDDGPGSEGPYVIVTPGTHDPETAKSPTDDRPLVEQTRVRRRFLDRNRDKLVAAMRRIDDPDPVGIAIDLRDLYGRKVAETFGMTEDEINEAVESYTAVSMIPTAILAIPFETAKIVMPSTSPTALQSLSTPRLPGYHWIIAIMAKGNSYAALHLGHERRSLASICGE